MAKVTSKSVTDAQIESLKNAAGQAADFRQVGMCVLALDGEIDFDDWTVFSTDDKRALRAMTREQALDACVDAINDAAGR